MKKKKSDIEGKLIVTKEENQGGRGKLGNVFKNTLGKGVWIGEDFNAGKDIWTSVTRKIAVKYIS